MLSRSGDCIAFFIASCAASSPLASPTPIKASPLWLIIVLTSAKSRFMSLFPESSTIVLMPLTALASTSSTISKLSFIPAFLSINVRSLSFGITTIESLSFLSSSRPQSASFLRFFPSNIKGIVTTATVSAPISFAA